MGRLTSCWEAFVVLLFVSTTFAGTVVFPDVESCTLHTGEQGRCLPLPQCPPVLETIRERHPVSCGFEGFTQIVCCPKGEDTTPREKIVDISPPQGYDALDCGKSAVKVIQGFGPGFGLPASTVSLIRSRRANVPLGSLADKAHVTVPPPVVGGQISERSAWPWMALIGERDPAGINWFCGGALINEYWVLTALHCFHNKKADVVRLGEHDYSTDSDGANPIDIPVAERVLYPDYIYPHGYHDLALLKLESKVTLQTFISPVCLPWGSKSEENIVNSQATVTGWGFTLFGGFPSPELMEVDIQVFPSSRCNSSYSSLLHFPDTWPRGIGEETLCAGDDEGGKDSCQGDSGGPLVTRDSRGRYVAAGIVSQGHGCGHKDYPGLYANLRYPAYLAWIKKVAFGPQ
ncbi:venom protease-like [Portunus trituberculatus]|uniref:venom protease-like n=1 Tax=Portunus trituberculatus TaxID=210409 RepID=UPI001E1D1338|nr:venom protease-like [Portunus trituberculatus]XP_045128935.1 venom protease-like [Portunus trituberculatus]XP_045128936.1 venom protease-like [Portunus trituberculatus]